MSDSKRLGELEVRVETLEERLSELRSYVLWLEKEVVKHE